MNKSNLLNNKIHVSCQSVKYQLSKSLTMSFISFCFIKLLYVKFLFIRSIFLYISKFINFHTIGGNQSYIMSLFFCLTTFFKKGSFQNSLNLVQGTILLFFLFLLNKIKLKLISMFHYTYTQKKPAT